MRTGEASPADMRRLAEAGGLDVLEDLDVAAQAALVGGTVPSSPRAAVSRILVATPVPFRLPPPG